LPIRNNAKIIGVTSSNKCLLFFKKILFIYLRERKGEGETEGEADSPLSREPDAGLNPRTLRS